MKTKFKVYPSSVIPVETNFPEVYEDVEYVEEDGAIATVKVSEVLEQNTPTERFYKDKDFEYFTDVIDSLDDISIRENKLHEQLLNILEIKDNDAFRKSFADFVGRFDNKVSKEPQKESDESDEKDNEKTKKIEKKDEK